MRHCERSRFVHGCRDRGWLGALRCACWTSIAGHQQNVVRATLSAELLGACDATDRGLVLAQMLHHIDVPLKEHASVASVVVVVFYSSNALTR